MGNEARKVEHVIEQAYFTTTQAAQFTGKTLGALRMAVKRKVLIPVAYGQRGRHREHQFTREDLDAYMRKSG